ncbi:MAG TPA: glutathione S-transferase N-terminal domain-containing protein [Solirubrobacteraceae bacterium]|nr:glutathione S-transferase N-terminal domain-containing protein [Solirubrobacteraceae bacterium]
MAKNTPRLYVLPGSHPCDAVEVAMKLKSIAYKRVDLLPMSQVLVGPLRYGGTTVPGLRVDGERLVGSRAIMRRLDDLVAEPALLPAPGSPTYAQVLEAERWGDEVLQSIPRRVLDVAFLRQPEAMVSYAGDAKLPLPVWAMRPALPLTARLMAMKNSARDDVARADLAALPGQLDRIDAWIADGLLGGEQPNAADLQIGSTIRLLLTLADVRPLLQGRPCAELVRYFPPMVGEVPAGVLPAEWVPAGAATTA